MSGPKLILLDPRDNVLVCTAPIAAGEALPIDGAVVAAPEDVAVGHKVARVDLADGEKVLKYGAPIGSMKAAAAKGAWIHMHNMKSDYIPTHDRKTASQSSTA
ncbi:UxaA family hydrolase [Sphingosinicella terrae]|uniref:UxaA family hydrolase n=1 Tax=Sphingosinicella terrae TaxID=2172047 RepID=UPI000E0D2FC1|nr:UxaA family hydrolase [Sphingosinicella terrae]